MAAGVRHKFSIAAPRIRDRLFDNFPAGHGVGANCAIESRPAPYVRRMTVPSFNGSPVLE